MADNIQTNIEIKADTKQALDKVRELNQAISQFNRAVNQQNADALKTAKALEKQVIGTNFANNFNTQIVRMSSSVEQFSQKLDKGKVGFQEYRKLLDRENGMLEQVAQRRVKLMQSMQIAMTGQIRGGQRGGLVIPQEFDKLNSATSNLNAFGKQMDLTTQKSVLLNEAMRQGAIQLTNWGKNMQWAGRQLTVGLTLPITAFAAVATKAFSDVEEQLIQIRRVYGDLETTDYEKALGEKQLLDAAEAWTKYGVSVSDALKVGAQVAATGAKGAEAVSQMNEAIRFATLGNFDLADSQQAVIAMMSSMGIASKDLRGEIDYLNAVENQTLLTMQDVADAVPRVGPVLKDMGGDVRDLTALLAAMKEGGVDAAEGANALKSGLASLINPTKEAKDAFEGFGIDLNSIVTQGQGNPVKMIQDLGKSLEGLSNLAQQRLVESLFGKYQFARWSALFDNINKAGSQAQETLKLAGMSAEELAQISNSELSKIEESPLTKFNKNLEDLKLALVPIGEMVLKVLNPFLDALNGIADFIGKNDIAKWAIGLGGAFIAVVGPITMLAGLIGNLLGNLAQFRAFLGKRRIGETFMTELEIQGKLAAVALDQFGKEAEAGLSILNAQSTAVRDLASEYNILAASVERAAIEISHTANDPTRSRAGTTAAAEKASRYRYRRRFATGGTVPGSGSGDKIPAMLEPGEFVVSKSAAQKFGPTLNAMNSGTMKGMQGGGLIEESHIGAGKTVNISQLIDEQEIRNSVRQMARTILAIFGDIAIEIKHAMVLNLPKEINQALKTTIPGQGAPAGHVAQVLTGAAERGEAGGLLVSRRKSLPRGLNEYEKQLAKAGLSQAEIAETMVQVNKEANIYAKELAKNVQLLAESNSDMVNDAILEEAHQKTLKENTASLQHFSRAANALTDTASEVRIGLEGAGTRIQEFIKSAPRGNIISQTTNKLTGTKRTIQEILDPTTGQVVGQAKYRQARGKEEQFEAFRAPGTAAFIRSQKDPFPLRGFSRRMSEIPQQIVAPVKDWMSPQDRQAAIRELEKTVEQTGKQTTEALRKATRSKSPSKDAEKVGKDFALGYAQGIESGQPQVALAAEHLADVSMKSLKVSGTIPTRSPAYASSRVAQISAVQQAAAEREQHIQATREAIAANPVLPSPQAAPRVRQAAEYMDMTQRAAKASAEAQSKVAVEATEAATGLNKLSTTTQKTSKLMADTATHGGGFNKFLFGLDAISGALMFTEGPLGEFANKLFIASSALTALSMIPGVGKVTGKVGGAVKGGIGRVVGKIAPRLAGVAGGAAAGGLAAEGGAAAVAGIGTVAAPLLAVAAAAAAVGGAFYLLYRHQNKYDTALLDTTENMKSVSEKLGYVLKTPQLTAIGGGKQDSKTASDIKEIIQGELKKQIEYINSLNDKTERSRTVDSIVAQYIAAGMPKEYAQELARQLATATETSLTNFTSKVANLYDESGALKNDAGKELLKSTTSVFTGLAERINKQEAERKLNQTKVPAVAPRQGSPRGTSGPQSNMTDQEKRRSSGHVIEEAGKISDEEQRRKAAADNERRTSSIPADIKAQKQEMETVANSVFPVLQTMGELLQNNMISAKDYFDNFKNLSAVTKAYGGDLKAVTKKFVEINPALAGLESELNKSGSSAQLMALQMAGVDITPFTTALADGSIAVENFSKFLQDKIFPLVQEVQQRESDLIAPQQDKITEATARIATLQENAKGYEQAIQDAQDAIDGIDAKWQGELDTLDERQYKIDRSNYSLKVQTEIQQDIIDKEQEQIDLIDKEIDKINEAHDKRVNSINDTADAQLKALDNMQQAAQRGIDKQSSFNDIGQALQSGDISQALRLQEQYTQDFGQNSYQDQIQAVNDWKDAAIKAADDEQKASVDAENKKKEAHQKTIDAHQKQIDMYAKEEEANSRLSDSINERTAVIEHQKEVEKKKYEAAQKAAQDAEKNNAKEITAQNTIIENANKEIQSIHDNGAALIKSIEDFQVKFGLKPDEVTKVLTGNIVDDYLQSSPSTLSYTINGQEFKMEPIKKHSGGVISGTSSKQPGLKSDEVPAVLQTGEYVMQRSAVKKIGTNVLDRLNKSNIPRQRRALLNSESYESYHEGGVVAGSASFPLAVNALLAQRMQQQAMQNYGIASAMVAAKQQSDATGLGEIGSQLAGAVDWSKVSGGPGGQWHWPVPGYSQNVDDFGYIGNRTDRYGRPRKHAGWDIGVPSGTVVHAIRSGTVVASAHSGSGAGTWMALDHGGGLFTRYLHLLRPLRKIGDEVQGGAPIAQANTSGTTVPHLHFEITRNRDYSDFSAATDPIKYFRLHEPYSFHEGGVVGTNEVPAILEKGEFVIPKDKWQYGDKQMSMPSYNAGSGNNFSMPTYSPSTSSVAPVAASGGGGSGGGGVSSSYSNNASNAYTINVNVNGTNASAQEIANTVYARINRTQRISRR